MEAAGSPRISRLNCAPKTASTEEEARCLKLKIEFYSKYVFLSAATCGGDAPV